MENNISQFCLYLEAPVMTAIFFCLASSVKVLLKDTRAPDPLTDTKVGSLLTSPIVLLVVVAKYF